MSVLQGWCQAHCRGLDTANDPRCQLHFEGSRGCRPGRSVGTRGAVTQTTVFATDQRSVKSDMRMLDHRWAETDSAPEIVRARLKAGAVSVCQNDLRAARGLSHVDSSLGRQGCSGCASGAFCDGRHSRGEQSDASAECDVLRRLRALAMGATTGTRRPHQLSSTQRCRVHKEAAPAPAGAAWPGATHPRGVLRPRIPARDRPFASVPRCSGARLCDCGRGAELTEPDTSVLSAEVHTTHRESARPHTTAPAGRPMATCITLGKGSSSPTPPRRRLSWRLSAGRARPEPRIGALLLAGRCSVAA